MMEPEYDFDEDDLINDYMEDGFDEHPPEEEFPDDYEMFEAKAAPTQKPPSQPIQPSQQMQSSPIKAPAPAPNATTPPLQSAPLSEIHIQSLPKRSADLYSFER